MPVPPHPLTSPATSHPTTPVDGPPRSAPLVLSFDLAMNHVLLRARVNGAEGWLIVDTGSSLTSLDAQWAREIGARASTQPVQVLGTGGITTTLATVDSLELPGLVMRELTAVLIPLDAVSRVHGRPIRGTLGYDFLSRYVVEIDYAARELRLHDPAAYEYAGRGTIVPVSLQYRVPVVDATIVPLSGPPIPARLLLDLGTSTLVALLTTPFVEAHGLATTAGAVDAPLGTGVGGQSLGRVARARELRLGGLVVPGPTLGLGRERVGFLGSTFVDGAMGAPLFERTTMLLDYARERVIFEPGARFAAPFEYDASGLHVATGDPERAGAPTVTFVVANGPADAAGVHVGDEIVAVGGREASTLTLDELWRTLRGTGPSAGATGERTLGLTLRRAGALLDVELQLRPLV